MIIKISSRLFSGTASSFSIGTLVVGGVSSSKAEFPFIVSIRANNRHICGGTILDSEWIVTAAHCAVYSMSTYTIVAGEHNLNVAEGTEQERKLSRIISHENYNSYAIKYLKILYI